MFTARQLVEPSRKRSSKPKAERSPKIGRPKEESPEEKELRREEHRIRKLERDARRAAEAAAIMGVPSRVHKKNKEKKSKGKEILDSDSESDRSSKSSKPPKKSRFGHDEALAGLAMKKPKIVLKKSEAPKPEVRSSTHDSHNRNINLNNIKDSSTAHSRESGSEHRRHRHHEHSSLESELSCSRCVKRKPRREERVVSEVRGVGTAAKKETSDRISREEREAIRRIVEEEERRERLKAEDSRLRERPKPEKEKEKRSKSKSKETSSRRINSPPRRRKSPSRDRNVEPTELKRVRIIPKLREEYVASPRRSTRTMVPQVEIIPATHRERQPSRRSEHRNSLPEQTSTERAPRDNRRHLVFPQVTQTERIIAAERVRQEQERPREPDRTILSFEVPQESEKLVKCITCMDDEVLAGDAAQLVCGHWFCNECLKRLFTLSLTDPAHMPPRCCTQDHIPLHHVSALLPHATKKLWNRKYREYTTSNRVYCPNPKCGEWIEPEHIGSKIGKCSRCKRDVCARCKGAAHEDRDCPEDPEMVKFFEVAEREKYQKCYNCRAMVELERGCNHMTCHCTAQFCYVCGKKWKTCACPWFNYEHGGNAGQGQAPPHPIVHRPPHQRNINGLPPDEEAPDPEPLIALNVLGAGLRRLAGYAAAQVAAPVPARATREPRAADAEGQLPTSQPLPGSGPGVGLGLARHGGGPTASLYPPRVAAGPSNAATVATSVIDVSPVNPRQRTNPSAPPRSNYLTESQQAHMERYIDAVDLVGAEPGVDTPFSQASAEELPEGEDEGDGRGVVETDEGGTVATRPVETRRMSMDVRRSMEASRPMEVRKSIDASQPVEVQMVRGLRRFAEATRSAAIKAENIEARASVKTSMERSRSLAAADRSTDHARSAVAGKSMERSKSVGREKESKREGKKKEVEVRSSRRSGETSRKGKEKEREKERDKGKEREKEKEKERRKKTGVGLGLLGVKALERPGPIVVV